MKTPKEEDIKEVAEWLQLKLTTGRVSRLFVEQLAIGMINRTIHVHRVYDEIGALEGAPHSRPTNSKPPSQFTGRYLRGLWHKHYSDPSHLFTNVGLHWSKKFREFARFLNEDILAGQPSVELSPEVMRRISHEFVMTAHKDRNAAKEMTGEWIVYANHNGQNYYLTIGTHDEGDEAIAIRVHQCAAEFPDLQLPAEQLLP